MNPILVLLAIIAAWIVFHVYLLPRLGVKTCLFRCCHRSRPPEAEIPGRISGKQSKLDHCEVDSRVTSTFFGERK